MLRLIVIALVLFAGRAAPAGAERADDLIRRGNILTGQHKLEDANVCFEQALRLRPKDAAARRSLAANQWQLGQLAKARENLERLRKSDPKDAQATLLLGMVEEASGQYAKAATLLTGVPGLVRQHTETVAALASAYYRTGRAVQADALLRPLAARARTDSQGVFLAARVAADNRDWPTADVLFRAVRPVYADRTTVDYNLALTAFRQDRFAEAQEILEGLALAGASRGDIYNLLGWCRHRLDHAQGAVDAFQQAIAVDPRNLSHYLDLINILLERSVYAAARDAAGAAVRRFPDSAEIRQLLGSAEFKLNNYRAAAAAFERAAQLNPASADLQVSLAAALWSAGEREQAEAVFDRAIRQFPKNAAAYDAYGTFLMEVVTDEAGRKRATTLLEQALALDEHRFEPHYQLGYQVLRKDPASVSPTDLAEALRQLERAAALAPANSKTYYALSRVLQWMGREEDARRELETFRRLRSAQLPAGAAGGSQPDKP